MNTFRLAVMLVGSAVLAACASTDYGARAAGERPADLSSSEASFWYQMDKVEDDLKTSGRVLDAPELQAFVEQATCQIAGQYCDDLRVYILNEPSFNASMAPNGMMLVHTGLMLRARNESELAAVLAHEFVHYEENHILERYGATKNASRSMAVASGFGIVGLLGIIAIADGTSGFAQDQETEADLKGLTYMTSAGFNAESASELWSTLSAEFAASDAKQKKKRAVNGQWLATHPGIGDRVAALKAQAEAYDPVETDEQAYRTLIRPYLKSWLDAEVAKSDPGSTLYLVEQLENLGEDLGTLALTRGRVTALRGEPGDLELAKEAYQAAITHSDVPAEAHRMLGEIHRDEGSVEEAKAAFSAYLIAAPEARDRALVERMIEKLEGS